MFEYLIVRWKPGEDRTGPLLHWLAVTHDGSVVDSGQGDLKGALACYQSIDRAPAVVLLAPACEVLLCSVEVLPEQQRHLKQVLPFLVEEKLVDDIEDVHIGIGPLEKGRPLPVAVVRHVDLISWLDSLYSAGLPPSRVVPEPLALPWQQGLIVVWLSREGCLIRDGQWHGMACDLDNLSLVLTGLCQRAQQSSGESPVDEIALYHAPDPDSAELAEALTCHLREFGGDGDGAVPVPPIRVTASQQELPLVLGSQLAREMPSALNLLQGGYATEQSGLSGSFDLRKIGLGFAACLVLHLVLTLGAGAWFNLRAQTVKADTTALYRGWFPEARRVFEPRRQLQSQLAGFSDHGSDRLVAYVDGITAQWASAPDKLRLVSLNFEAPSDTLLLELSAANRDVLEQLRDRLDASGFSSELQQLARQGDSVSGRLELGRLEVGGVM
jgi:general secretion pathway protein L